MTRFFRWLRALLNALWTVPVWAAALMPSVMAFVTVALFIGESASRRVGLPPGSPWLEVRLWSVAAGLLSGVVVWVVVAVLSRPFATARRAVPTSFDEFQKRRSQVCAQIAILTGNGLRGRSAEEAVQEIQTQLKLMEEQVKEIGFPWTRATGYLHIWDCLHRAEEALIEVQPLTDVVAGAAYDNLRLAGSNIDHAGQLCTILKRAMHELGPSATKYLPEDATAALSRETPEAVLSTSRAELVIVPVHSETPADLTDTHSKELPRAILRMVRRAINEYVDRRYKAFVLARNRLVDLLMLTGITVWALLSIAIMEGAPPTAIAAASVFYLTGTIIGSLDRLYLGSREQARIEILDYGLSDMRLVAQPTVSGIAAVAGIMLAAAGGSVFTNEINVKVPTLSAIFDLHSKKFLVWLLTAAVFGLTPAVLFARLHRQADQYASDLAKTEATDSRNRPS